MNTKRFVLAVIAVFVVVFGFDFLVHGILLKGMYEATSQLWRPEDQHHMEFILMSQFSFALIVAFFYTRNYEGRGLCEGVRFGLLIGLVLGSIQIGTYCYMAIPLELTLAWVAASIGKGLVAGLALSLAYKE